MSQETEPELKWTCWVLSEEEIYVVAAEHGIKKEQIEEMVPTIASYFKKAVENILGSWDDTLWESIEAAVELHFEE